MNTFIAYIFLCASSIAASDCDTQSAIDVAVGPRTNNEIACAIEAQEMIAQTSIRPRDGEYLKISCLRRKSEAQRETDGNGAVSADATDATRAAADGQTGRR